MLLKASWTGESEVLREIISKTKRKLNKAILLINKKVNQSPRMTQDKKFRVV